MTTRLGALWRRLWDRRLVQQRLAAIREEAAAEAEQARRERAKAGWMVMVHALDAPDERLPSAVRASPALIAAAHGAAVDLYRAYRGYRSEPERAA